MGRSARIFETIKFSLKSRVFPKNFEGERKASIEFEEKKGGNARPKKTDDKRSLSLSRFHGLSRRNREGSAVSKFRYFLETFL